jgi:hypothetical protein
VKNYFLESSRLVAEAIAEEIAGDKKCLVGNLNAFAAHLEGLARGVRNWADVQLLENNEPT